MNTNSTITEALLFNHFIELLFLLYVYLLIVISVIVLVFLRGLATLGIRGFVVFGTVIIVGSLWSLWFFEVSFDAIDMSISIEVSASLYRTREECDPKSAHHHHGEGRWTRTVDIDLWWHGFGRHGCFYCYCCYWYWCVLQSFFYKYYRTSICECYQRLICVNGTPQLSLVDRI